MTNYPSVVSLAEESITGIPDQTVAELPDILTAMADNVDGKRLRNPYGRLTGG